MDNKVKELIDKFDFEKVHKVMCHLEWGWAFSEGVPSVKEMKDTAKKLLIDVMNNPKEQVSMGIGGFEVQKDHDWLELSFKVEEVEVGGL